MKHLRKIVILFLVAISPMLIAQTVTPVTLHLRFTQTKTVPMLTEPQVSTGVMLYRAPDYICWEYLTPTAVKWEMDGANSNVNRQVSGMITLIMESVQGKNLQTNEDFTVSQEGNRYTLIPKRRDIQKLFAEIVIVYNTQTGIADAVEMTERDNTHTIITFTPHE